MKDARQMLDDPRATQLDPDLLSTPFGVQTNWHVITGAACSGKITLINLLTDKGFRRLRDSTLRERWPKGER